MCYRLLGIATLPGCRGRAGAHGFTLVELVLVIVLLGILAVVAIPRLNTGDFDEYGYAGEAAAALRYARQVAVARNAPVTAAFGAGAFRIQEGFCPTSGGYLLNPATGQPWDGSAKGRGQAPAGVSVGSDTLVFDGLGRVWDCDRRPTSANIALGTQHTLRVEADTGHVRFD